ncbi:hypothetical protein ABIB42_002270 [Massilia sp. UYP32]|jgi:hypothetical protein|uniref:SGNH hydrolase-type esterase domain-containing protein n=1 Tax=Massilia timonae CCUG 45783 TaxID=883126 RepID=K9DIL2_9BURK|nr:hypothetical protein [Massilia timonae]EKU84619.1 hypothetical protein HMPREF9710_00054 [Massilia timonae CCUG 45783]
MQARRRSLLLAALLSFTSLAGARDKVDKADNSAHRFAVIGNSAGSQGDDDGEARLKQTLADSSEKSLAFVVINGIKGEKESCGDRLYQQRRDIIERARRPTIVSLAGSDWTACRNSANRTNAIERLNRLRELFHGEPESLGRVKIHLTQLSASPRFRSYAENAHWKVGKVLYATINLPANNNHYLEAAGRNSEYEDRTVANRFWLNRLFAIARSDKAEALVLFSEGAVRPFYLDQPAGLRGLLRRDPVEKDGFEAVRRQVQARAVKFEGKVLLVDSGTPHGKKPGIEWKDNLGQLSVGTKAVEVNVKFGKEATFAVEDAKQ